MNGHSYEPPCSAETLRALYEEKGMTQAEIAVQLGTTQKRVLTAMRRYAIPRRPAAKRDQRGSKNVSWKGDSAGYQALHLRVIAARGNPTECEQCGATDSKRYEWANLTGRYADPADYRRLCRSCHAKFDNAVQNLRRRSD